MGYRVMFSYAGLLSPSYGRPAGQGLRKMQVRPENLGRDVVKWLHLRWLPGKDVRVQRSAQAPQLVRDQQDGCSVQGIFLVA